MKMPQGYNETKASGEYTPVQVGGHKAIIMQVGERKNKNGGDMIVVAIDFAKEDKQAGYFADMFVNDTRDDKKWPNQGTQYINVNDNTGMCSRAFKTFCTCVEESNPGFQVKWDCDFAPQFKGKKIGAVYGMVEEFYNNKVNKRARLRWFTAYDKALEAKVPDEKLLNGTAPAATTFGPSIEDEQIPF